MPVMRGTVERKRRTLTDVARGWSISARTSYAYGKWRRPILYLTGFGFLDAAAFRLHAVIGLLAVGTTMFILEALSSDGRST